MLKDFLGRGWQFPFAFDPSSGSVQASEYEDNIRQCITVILGTKPGERQMLPNFGCRIHELMFAPNTRSTATLIAHYVEKPSAVGSLASRSPRSSPGPIPAAVCASWSTTRSARPSRKISSI